MLLSLVFSELNFHSEHPSGDGRAPQRGNIALARKRRAPATSAKTMLLYACLRLPQAQSNNRRCRCSAQSKHTNLIDRWCCFFSSRALAIIIFRERSEHDGEQDAGGGFISISSLLFSLYCCRCPSFHHQHDHLPSIGGRQRGRLRLLPCVTLQA